MLENENAQAMEYVLGTLRGAEREAFDAALQSRKDLQLQVSFWEEHLMDMQGDDTLAPQGKTWGNIHAAINNNDKAHNYLDVLREWFNSVRVWQSATAFMLAGWLAVMLIGGSAETPEKWALRQPNSDYVAVLTNQQGQAVLTAMTASTGDHLWLKWELNELPEHGSMQLWAVSKSDGGVRPLLVVEDELHKRVAIEEAEWRLIKDSSHLLLTEEEEGGSAFDEPSEFLLAKGVCIRLTETKKSNS